jgi:anti-sigma B factor antagonist
MDIKMESVEAALLVTVSGRLDTTTAPQLEQELNASLDDVTELVLDFTELEYLSSAGLRVLLGAQKRMNQQGSMVVRNVNQVIMEVFDITGFSGILTIVNHEG